MLDNEKIPFGELLRRLRKSKLLSQEELAFRCGRDRKYISDLERAVNQPGLATFINIATAFKMKPSELMMELEEKINFPDE